MSDQHVAEAANYTTQKNTKDEYQCAYWNSKSPINPKTHRTWGLSGFKLLFTWVMWEEVTRLEASPCEGCYDKCCLMGLCSSKAKAEGILLKVAWHWCSDSNVVNDPLVEPGRTTLYVDFPSAWGSMTVDFCLFSWEGSFMWTVIYKIYE